MDQGARRRRSEVGLGAARLALVVLLLGGACRLPTVGGPAPLQRSVRVGASHGDAEVALVEAEPSPASEVEEPGGELAVSEPAQETAQGTLPAAQPLGTPAEASDFRSSEANRLTWFAGRSRLAGIPAAAAAERERSRREALVAVRERFERSPESRAAWEEHLAFLLDGRELYDELWCAGARVVGELGVYELADKLVFELGPDRPPRRRAASVEALHQLYGRWFRELEEVGPYLERVEPGAGTRLLVANVLEEESLGVGRLLKSLEYEPLTAIDTLAHPNPRVRAGAARRLGEAIAARDLEAEEVLPILYQRLRLEEDPLALHAALEAVLVPLQSATVLDPALEELRGILEGLSSTAGPGHSLVLAQTLARLPWRTTIEGEGPTVAEGVAAIGRVLSGRIQDKKLFQHDSDALVGILGALLSLCDRAKDSAFVAELRESSAREPVRALIQDAQQEEAVRAAAVSALGPLAEPSQDWPLFLDVLRRGDSTPALSHALLGALRSILLEFDPESAGASVILDQVADLTGASDPDLRRRALSLLADQRLREIVRSHLEPTFLLECLRAEDVPDLASSVLELIRIFGRPDMLDGLLGLERFEELAKSGPDGAADLAGALRQVAAGSPTETWRAAEGLASVNDQQTYVARIQLALGMVASLDEAAALQLERFQHQEIALWAWLLHRAGIELDQAIEGASAFKERLVRLHLPKSQGVLIESATRFGESTRNHLLAVMLGELLLAGDTTVSVEEVDAAFTRSLEFVDVHTEPGFKQRVQRDRARFYAAGGDPVRAMREFRVLHEEAALENADLRQAAAINRTIGGEGLAGRRATAPECFDLLETLVTGDTWVTEPAKVRRQDLSDLAGHAVDSQSEERLQRFLELFAGLPATPEDGDEPVTVWRGLAGSAEVLVELQKHVEAVQTALGKVRAKTTETPPSPPADG